MIFHDYFHLNQGLGERKHYKFIDQLLCDNRYTSLLLVYVYNAI